MKRNIRIGLVIAAGFLPLLFKLPYMRDAWRYSPQDRLDWVFGVLFLVGAAVAARETLRRRGATDWSGLIALLAGIGLCGAAWFGGVHALAIVGAIVLSWALVWVMLGWRSAACVFPSYCVLMLMCTSSSYWLSFLAGDWQLDGLKIKFVLSFIFLVWQAWVLWREPRYGRESFWFMSVALGLGLLVLQSEMFTQQAAPFHPELGEMALGAYLGRPQELTDADRRFFGSNRLNKFIFASDNGSLQILAVTCGDDIHQIHPAGHCLRSGGWTVRSERLRKLEFGGRPVAVNEIVANQRREDFLIRNWYSSPEYSTGSFLSFRRNWRKGAGWRAYLISTPIAGDQVRAEKLLDGFMDALSAPGK